MKNNAPVIKKNIFERVASSAHKAAGSSHTIAIAFFVVLMCAASGPFFHYSQSWQLVVNTSMTIITFLMIFVILTARNKNSLAIQQKLNELIASEKLLRERQVSEENITQDEVKIIKKPYGKLRKFSEQDDFHQSYFIDEAHKSSKN